MTIEIPIWLLWVLGIIGGIYVIPMIIIGMIGGLILLFILKEVFRIWK